MNNFIAYEGAAYIRDFMIYNIMLVHVTRSIYLRLLKSVFLFLSFFNYNQQL